MTPALSGEFTSPDQTTIFGISFSLPGEPRHPAFPMMVKTPTGVIFQAIVNVPGYDERETEFLKCFVSMDRGLVDKLRLMEQSFFEKHPGKYGCFFHATSWEKATESDFEVLAAEPEIV